MIRFRMSVSKLRFVALIAVLSLFACASLYAQVAGATLSGLVTDPSGAVIPNAQVAIKSVATGVTRTVTTDNAGLYSAPNLLPGNYTVTVSAQGFATFVQSNLTLTVGAQQALNVSMKLGQSTEKVEVTGAVSPIQLATSTLSAQVNETTVRQLPLNGRDWTQLATLQPGVVTVDTQASTNSATTNRGNRGFGNQLTDSGHSPYENNYRVNGISINDYTNGSPGSVIGVNLGVDAIQEFSVLTTDYTSEYGMTSGAVINAITKSGTNDFHGSAYGFLRDEGLDAKNYFDSPTSPIPSFHRNQFGVSAGGPIRKNKTFIFGDYESILQNQSATFAVHAPSAAARNGTLCSIPVGCATTQIAVSPAIKPFLNFWPTTTGTLSPNGDIVNFTQPGLLRLREHYVTLRLDHHISQSDTLAGSWFYDHAPQSQPDPMGNVLTNLLSSRQMYSIEETHIFSPTLVNTARFGFNRVIGLVGQPLQALNPIAADPSLGSIPGHNAAIISVPGLTPTASLGSSSNNQHYMNTFQYYDDAFLNHGKHTIKFGFAVEREQYDVFTRQRANGSFNFGSLQAFLQDTPASVQLLNPTIAKEIGTRQTAFGFYVADDWRALSNLTLNLGIRYEPTTLPTEAQGRFQVLPTLTSAAVVPVSTAWPHNQTLRNFEPRVGFSWDPSHNGKMAIRGGFGVFDLLPMNWIYTFSSSASIPFTQAEKASNLTTGDFPNVPASLLGPASAQVRYFDPNPPTSYSTNWNLNIQRELTANWFATVGYVGSHSVHLPDTPDDINWSLPTLQPFGYTWPLSGGSKLNPNVGGIRPTLWTNSSNYEGLQAGLTKRMSYGLQLQGSYDYGRCIDTGSNLALSDPFINSNLGDYMYFDKRLTRGLCDFSISQSFSLSYIWDVPAPKGHSFADRVAGGWQVGGILRAQTGSPFSVVIGGDPLGRNAGDTEVDYPDRVKGCNLTTGSINGYINMNCFTVPTAPASAAALCNTTGFSGAAAAPSGFVNCANLLGTAGRNELVGPRMFNLDFSLFKNVALPSVSEAFNVQFRAEFFNVLNHPNFLPPLDNSIIFNQNGSPVQGAGQIDSTATDNRQIQFGLRVVW